MNSRRLDVLIAYVASPHAGYLKLFRAHAGSILYVLGEEFIQTFPSLTRHLPGVKPEESRKMIEALGIFAEVRILTAADLDSVKYVRVIMPDEDVSHAFAEKYLAESLVEFDGQWRLRWDWGAVKKSRRPESECTVSFDEFERNLMQAAFREANRSPDWWRQIGALLVQDGLVSLVAFNRHVPSDQSAYVNGDPRSNFDAGQCIDVSGALHAEAGLVAAAVERGISMKGCDLYVTTFPCPPCAYLSAFTGIKRLFYADGYSLIAGAETLQSKNVEIIRVDMNSPSS